MFKFRIFCIVLFFAYISSQQIDYFNYQNESFFEDVFLVEFPYSSDINISLDLVIKNLSFSIEIKNENDNQFYVCLSNFDCIINCTSNCTHTIIDIGWPIFIIDNLKIYSSGKSFVNITIEMSYANYTGYEFLLDLLSESSDSGTSYIPISIVFFVFLCMIFILFAISYCIQKYYFESRLNYSEINDS